MRFEAVLGIALEIKAEDIETALRRDPAVELTKRPCGGIAAVGKAGKTVLYALGVERFKRLVRHIDLASDDQCARNIADRQGDRTDRAQILRHFLADEPVAARRAADEYPVFIFKRNGKPVDFKLDDILRILD